MKLLKKILIGTAALAALSSTLAFADDNLVLIPNNHGSYSLITRTSSDTQMVGLSVSNSSCSAACSTNCMASPSNESGSPGNYMVTLRDNGHGQQVVR